MDNQTENSDKEEWNQERCQPAVDQVGHIENVAKSLEPHGITEIEIWINLNV